MVEYEEVEIVETVKKSPAKKTPSTKKTRKNILADEDDIITEDSKNSSSAEDLSPKKTRSKAVPDSEQEKSVIKFFLKIFNLRSPPLLPDQQLVVLEFVDKNKHNVLRLC